MKSTKEAKKRRWYQGLWACVACAILPAVLLITMILNIPSGENALSEALEGVGGPILRISLALVLVYAVVLFMSKFRCVAAYIGSLICVLIWVLFCLFWVPYAYVT